MYTVYLLTNRVSGKVYVGVTGNLTRRLAAHKHSGQPKTRSPQRYLSRAIRKDGWSNFQCDVLETTTDKEHAWKVLEPKYILQYQTYNPTIGYNLTNGGDGAPGWVCSDDTKQRMSENHWSKHGGVHGMLGKTHTKEVRALVGSKNAKYQWSCVSPTGERYVTDTIGLFVKEHQLNLDAVYNFEGNAVPAPKSRGVTPSVSRINSTGWEFSKSLKA